jgi:hypothetical protein
LYIKISVDFNFGSLCHYMNLKTTFFFSNFNALIAQDLHTVDTHAELYPCSKLMYTIFSEPYCTLNIKCHSNRILNKPRISQLAKKFPPFMELINRFCVYKSPALWTVNQVRYTSTPRTKNLKNNVTNLIHFHFHNHFVVS